MISDRAAFDHLVRELERVAAVLENVESDASEALGRETGAVFKLPGTGFAFRFGVACQTCIYAARDLRSVIDELARRR